MARWLVTGGAGFIGSHLAMALLDRGETVRVADDLSTGKPANLALLAGRAEVLTGDLADVAFARAATRDMDVVLHQAAIPSVPRSVADPLTSHRANVDATLAVLVGAREAGVGRLVYAGSSSAYGDSPELPKREDMAPNPLSPYALQKLVGEQYLQMFTRLYGLDTVTVRYFNVFGPRQDPSSQYSGVIALFVTRLLAGQPPLIIGDGEQTRDFTYIDNVVDGVLRAATAPGATGRVINVATGGQISINQLARTIQRLLGSDLAPLYAEARAGDVRDSLADIRLARQVLGYEPRISFEEGLRRTIDWYRAAQA
ncbi:MAG: SDR family oxidoreductase [Vicinamibacteria bacterium]|nr:SDR family oxidoreductase [Vicinamibacteria bacterium]